MEHQWTPDALTKAASNLRHAVLQKTQPRKRKSRNDDDDSDGPCDQERAEQQVTSSSSSFSAAATAASAAKGGISKKQKQQELKSNSAAAIDIFESLRSAMQTKRAKSDMPLVASQFQAMQTTSSPVLFPPGSSNQLPAPLSSPFGFSFPSPLPQASASLPAPPFPASSSSSFSSSSSSSFSSYSSSSSSSTASSANMSVIQVYIHPAFLHLLPLVFYDASHIHLLVPWRGLKEPKIIKKIEVFDNFVPIFIIHDVPYLNIGSLAEIDGDEVADSLLQTGQKSTRSAGSASSSASASSSTSSSSSSLSSSSTSCSSSSSPISSPHSHCTDAIHSITELQQASLLAPRLLASSSKSPFSPIFPEQFSIILLIHQSLALRIDPIKQHTKSRLFDTANQIYVSHVVFDLLAAQASDIEI